VAQILKRGPIKTSRRFRSPISPRAEDVPACLIEQERQRGDGAPQSDLVLVGLRAQLAPAGRAHVGRGEPDAPFLEIDDQVSGWKLADDLGIDAPTARTLRPVDHGSPVMDLDGGDDSQMGRLGHRLERGVDASA
jgi:hypothetical protein